MMSQQLWCWGQDILRSEGNWLVEIGFDRTEALDNQDSGPGSVYTLNLPFTRCVVLRGFGVFYGNCKLGGIYVPRYDFEPLYTEQSSLNRPLWSDADLPCLNVPTELTEEKCISLTLELIDWIQDYERRITECLGLDYRRRTLTKWDNGKRRCVSADEMIPTWQDLSRQIAANPQRIFKKHP